MDDLTRLVRQGLKRGLAVVLFTVLLVGGAGAVISAFAAGVTALSNVHASWEYPSNTTSVAVIGPSSTQPSAPEGASTYGNSSSGVAATASSSSSSDSARLDNSSATGAAVQSSSRGSQASAQAKQSPVDRFNQELSQMQSPVMQHLDAGGVSLGDQVQNAFGSFLSGLLQTLFVEEPNQASSAGTPSQAGGQ